MISRNEVGVVILNYKDNPNTISVLNKLVAFIPAENIVVVDNNSGDFDSAAIKSIRPQINIILNELNSGFGAGNNRGISLLISKGLKYIWLLNNDTEPSEHVLNDMLDQMDADNLGAVGCKLINPSGDLQAYGGGRVNLYTGFVWHNKNPKAKSIDYLIAASALVRSEVFEKVGLFDERFFMYWEDTDLFIRIKRAGYNLGFSKEVALVHYESASTGRYSEKFFNLFYASAKLFFSKHARFPHSAFLGLKLLFFLRRTKDFLLGLKNRLIVREYKNE